MPTTEQEIPVTPEEEEAWQKMGALEYQRGFIIPSPDMIMIGAIAVLTLTTFLFYNLYRGAVDDLATYRAQVEAVQEAVKQENDRKVAELLAINKRLDAGWTAAQRELARRGVIRVQPNRCEGAVPTVSGTSGKPDAVAAELVISTGECEAIANNAVQDAAQVMWLQDFIRQQREATK